MNKHKFIFIGGLHRSGTWLQTHCLQEHPQISRLGTVDKQGVDGKSSKFEGQFLQTVYPDDQYYGGVGRLGFHPEVHLTESSHLVTDENRGKLFSEWSRYWDTSKPYLLEKTPANLLRSRFLQAMFPNTYFIFVMRHPVAVALAQQKWSGTSVSSLIEHWLACYETLHEDTQHLKNFLHLRYEDFIHDPVGKLEQVYTFLGMESRSPGQEVRSDGNDKYFEIWDNARTTRGDARTFMRRVIGILMPPAIRFGYPITILANEVDSIIQRYESRVNAFGYSLIDLRSCREISTPNSVTDTVDIKEAG